MRRRRRVCCRLGASGSRFRARCSPIGPSSVFAEDDGEESEEERHSVAVATSIDRSVELDLSSELSLG